MNLPISDIPPPENRSTAAADQLPARKAQEPETKGQWVGKVEDPHGRHGIDLGDGRRLRFLLGRRFKQNVIKFVATAEGVDPRPSKEDTEFLKANGWRLEDEEQAWTKQFAKNTDEDRWGRAKSDRQAEAQFVTLANAVRGRNGLEPTGYDFGQNAARTGSPGMRRSRPSCGTVAAWQLSLA